MTRFVIPNIDPIAAAAMANQATGVHEKTAEYIMEATRGMVSELHAALAKHMPALGVVRATECLPAIFVSVAASFAAVGHDDESAEKCHAMGLLLLEEAVRLGRREGKTTVVRPQ